MKNKDKRLIALLAIINRPSAGQMHTGKKDKKRERKEGKKICREARGSLSDFFTDLNRKYLFKIVFIRYHRDVSVL